MASAPTSPPKLPRPQLTPDEIKKKPSRFIGYKGFSEWFASDSDHFVVRRFDTLSARVILSLQWEISKLETKLSELDYKRSHQTAKDLHNGSFEADDDERRDHLRSIQAKLAEYNEFVNGYAELRKRPEASAENIASVQNWLKDHAGAISEPEVSFVDGKTDLIAISPASRLPQRRKLLNLLIIMVGFLMIVAPPWALFFCPTRRIQMGVIVVFIFLFLCLVQSIKTVGPFESLAATAAYSAVLMIFLQISAQNDRTKELVDL